MNILEKIISLKAKDLERIKEQYPINLLESSKNFDKPTISFISSIKNNFPIIAEFKRKSPSKGIINDVVSIEDVVSAYQKSKVAGISILTESNFFSGSNDDLLLSRSIVEIPILRKDFIFDEYQVIEAKSIGADIILIIAKSLSDKQIKKLSNLSKQLDMEVLLEIDSKDDLFKINQYVDIIGINNRNLNTFDVSLDNSLKLIDQLPKGIIKLSESGINNADSIRKLKSIGFDAFLIGEFFMRDTNPGNKCMEFVKEIKTLL